MRRNCNCFSHTELGAFIILRLSVGIPRVRLRTGLPADEGVIDGEDSGLVVVTELVVCSDVSGVVVISTSIHQEATNARKALHIRVDNSKVHCSGGNNHNGLIDVQG